MSRQLFGFPGGIVLDDHKDRAAENPIEWLPLAVPQFMVASVVLEPSAAQAYAAAAQSAGDKATVITLENAGHFNMLSPADPTWAPVEAAILAAAKAEQ